jgi:hypothetical protein
MLISDIWEKRICMGRSELKLEEMTLYQTLAKVIINSGREASANA